MECLNPDMWFMQGHDHAPGEWEYNLDFDSSSKMEYQKIRSGSFVRSPSPCTAEVPVEELQKARHK